LAIRAAKRSIVLLKNEEASNGTAGSSGDHATATKLLPLNPETLGGKVVCILGPNSNDTMNLMGGYVNHGAASTMPTIQGAFQQVLLWSHDTMCCVLVVLCAG